MIENSYWSSYKLPVIRVIFKMKLEICRQVFEKYSNTKFLENPSSESLIVPCGWTDGKTYDEAE